METKSESNNRRVLLAGLALVWTANLASAQQPAAGVVRISDRTVNQVNFADTTDWYCDQSDQFLYNNRQLSMKLKHKFGCACHSCMYENHKAFVRPPAGTRLAPRNAQYQRYWSDAWMGVPSGPIMAQYPMVYQPTDTTQLGFYYQHVPTWTYRSGVLPPAPRPNWPLNIGYGSVPCINDGWVMESAVDVTPQQITPTQPAVPGAEEGTIVPEPEANLPRRIN